jgi:hypothetical protein
VREQLLLRFQDPAQFSATHLEPLLLRHAIIVLHSVASSSRTISDLIVLNFLDVLHAIHLRQLVFLDQALRPVENPAESSANTQDRAHTHSRSGISRPNVHLARVSSCVPSSFLGRFAISIELRKDGSLLVRASDSFVQRFRFIDVVLFIRILVASFE